MVHHDGHFLPVQVCWDGPAERHHRALEDFYERFPQAEEVVFATAEGFEEEVARVGRW